MDINYYFKATDALKPYTHSLPANTDSMPPASATRLEPEFKSGFWPCWDGEKWIQVKDHRGQKGYDKTTGVEAEVKDLGPWPEHLTVSPRPDSAYRWDGDGWVYDRSLDSPGPEYEWHDEDWWKVRFSKKDFLLLCGIERVVGLNAVIVGGNALAKTVHDLLFAADYIDVTDPATGQMVGLLATYAAGNVLTADDAARILQGVKHEKADSGGD